MENIALEYLEKDRILNMAMIVPVKRGTAEIIYAGTDGVYIKETVSNDYMISIEDIKKGKELADKTGKQGHILVYQKNLADYIHNKYKHTKYVENVQAVYTESEPVKSGSHNLDIEPLNLTHFDLTKKIFSHLKPDYIKGRIDSGAIYGGYFGGELCGFIGIHDEGSIGMLEVFEKYRGRGFAFELTSFMVNTLLSKGEIPFSQIEFDNEVSIGLHKKLGFEISDNTLYRLID